MATSIFGKVAWIILLVSLGSLEIRGNRRRSVNKPYVVNRWYSLPGYSETPYDECDAQDGRIQKVEVVPCDLDGDACILRSGTNATINLTFTSKVASASLKAVVHGVVGSIPIPFHIPQPNGCENSGVLCPLKPATSYSYTAQIPVLKSYPRLSVKVKWELVDADKKDIICVIIPAKIR